MTLALVTGATGLVGNSVARRLAAAGHRVRALVRDPARARAVLPESVELVRGDVTERASLQSALREVELLFHAAGMPEQWQADEAIFDRVNRGGTVNVLEAALDAGVRRAVYTSTMDVFAAPPGGTLSEQNLDEDEKPTAYERSKQAADLEVERLAAAGLDVVHVCPSAVYGPGPSQTGLNAFFVRLLRRKVPLLPPGGMPVVYVEAVTDMQLAAAERGRSGERYLVSDTHVSMRELAEAIVRAAPLPTRPPRAPAWLLGAVAAVSAPIARTLGVAPLISPGELSFLLWDVRVDATKAARELGFVPTALDEGVRQTIGWLRAEGLVPP